MVIYFHSFSIFNNTCNISCIFKTSLPHVGIQHWHKLSQLSQQPISDLTKQSLFLELNFHRSTFHMGIEPHRYIQISKASTCSLGSISWKRERYNQRVRLCSLKPTRSSVFTLQLCHSLGASGNPTLTLGQAPSAYVTPALNLKLKLFNHFPAFLSKRPAKSFESEVTK